MVALPTIIKTLAGGQDLTAKEAKQMQTEIIGGEAEKAQILEIFERMETKGLTREEFLGIVEATREHMQKITVDFECLDTCGTGGDKLHTFNISTATALVAAAAGIPVAKHGNRAASSQCGSADVLEELGVKLELDPAEAERRLREDGFVFLFAPIYHPALRFVREARQEFGRATYFNFLGPLLNPAGAKFQLIGVADAGKAELMGETLVKTGSKRVLVTSGEKGMDELSVYGQNRLLDFGPEGKSGQEIEVNLQELGLGTYALEDLKGGDARENARIIRKILANAGTEAQTAVVILNAAAAMLAFGKVKDLKGGVELAREVIKDGRAKKMLEKISA